MCRYLVLSVGPPTQDPRSCADDRAARPRPYVNALLAIAVLGALISGVGSGSAALLRVVPDGSGPYPTIQTAVEAAADGDTVLLGDGLFRGAGNVGVALGGRTLTLRSESGNPETCVIDCEMQDRWLLQLGTAATATRIGGVEVRRGRPSEPDEQGGALLVRGGHLFLEDCRFVDNGALQGAAIAIDAEVCEILRCYFYMNFTYLGLGSEGGCLHVTGGICRLRECRLAAGLAFRGAGIFGRGGVDLSADHCVLVGNVGGANGSGSALHLVNSTVSLNNCTLYNNSGDAVIGVEGASVGSMTQSLLDFGLFDFDAVGVLCEPGATFTMSDSDVWGSPLGFTGCLAGMEEQDGNFSSDPLLCDPEWYGLELCADSPCLPENHPAGLAIGALGLGCPGCGEVPVEPSTWGAIKLRYRRSE